jgi:hypothetical protein
MGGRVCVCVVSPDEDDLMTLEEINDRLNDNWHECPQAVDEDEAN